MVNLYPSGVDQTHRWLQAYNLPFPIKPTIEHCNHRVPITLTLNRSHIWRTVSLMRGSELMMADDVVITLLFPFGSPDVVLRPDAHIAY